MKTSLLLLSFLGACAAAHGQSSVIMAGTADAAAQRVTASTGNRYFLTSGNNSTSKLTIRGIEDMGGGLSAGFWLEAGFTLDTGAGQATNINNQFPSGNTAIGGLTFNRRSIVYLAGAWGELHLGRDWSPTYDVFTTKFDPFGVGSGLAVNYDASTNRNNIRVSNAIAYITPRFAGLSANIQHWLGENAPGTPTAQDGTGDGIRFNFDRGGFGSVASIARTRYAVGNAIYRNAGVTYDFGPVRLSANFNRDDQSGPNVKTKGWLAGLWVPLGAGEFKASYSRFATDAAGSPKAEKFAVGYVYNFSKRTALYTSLAAVRNTNGSAQPIVTGLVTIAPNTRSSGFDLGIRHNF